MTTLNLFNAFKIKVADLQKVFIHANMAFVGQLLEQP
jgi:hypothetical protein